MRPCLASLCANLTRVRAEHESLRAELARMRAENEAALRARVAQADPAKEEQRKLRWQGTACMHSAFSAR